LKSYSIPTIIMASICFTMAINEFLTWFRRTKKNSDIAFTLVCLGGTFFCLFCAGEYSSDFPLDSIPWLKGQVVSISFASFALFWFLSEETKLVKRQYLVAYLVWNALMSLSQLLNMGDLTWIADRPSILRVNLPFGLNFVYNEVESGILITLDNIVGCCILVHLVWIVAKFRRLGNRRESTVLFSVLGVCILAEINDFLVGLGVYSSIYLMEYAWLVAILIVGLRRSNEIMDALLTKRALQKSDKELTESQTMLKAIIDSTSDLIWSIDAETFCILAYNQGFREYFLQTRGVDVAVGMSPEELFQTEAEIVYWRDIYERGEKEGAYSIEHASFVDSSIYHLNVNPMERDEKVFGLSLFAKDITERKNAENQLHKSLLEKQTLLRELYHRTKNNMTVIISMLRLQSREIGDERLKKAFGETEGRIISMALVHEKLYEAQDLSHINLKEYFEDLIKQIIANYNLSADPPSLGLDMQNVFVLTDTAIACGLIVNELISNSLKYAFPSGRPGKILIRLHQEENGEIALIVSDDGVGLPPEFEKKRDGHLGLRLIDSLARGKLRAEFSLETDHGVCCRLRFREIVTI